MAGLPGRSTKGKHPAPYQVLFPIGIFSAVLGVMLWPLFTFGLVGFYPRDSHANLMMFGFLLAFASGFLMTAIPRISNTWGATPWEVYGMSFLATLQVACALFWPSPPVPFPLYIVSLQFGFLIFFAARRFFKSSAIPPASFLFLPASMILGISGALLKALPSLQGAGAAIGHVFLFKGVVMTLVLGVGLRLLPVFLHGAPPPNEPREIASGIGFRTVGLAALTYVVLLGLEPFFYVPANILQLALIAALIFPELEIHRKPRRKGLQPWAIWCSLWCILAGQAWITFFPLTAIHGLHLIYIGGWAIMVFFVATRVVLSHGGFPLKAELNSKLLLISFTLLVLAGAIRGSVAILPSTAYWSHIGYAAACWIAGVLVWASFAATKILRHSEDDDC